MKIRIWLILFIISFSLWVYTSFYILSIALVLEDRIENNLPSIFPDTCEVFCSESIIWAFTLLLNFYLLNKVREERIKFKEEVEDE